MARGGSRPGAGRKAGVKDRKPRSKAVGTPLAQKIGIKVAAMRFGDMALDTIVDLLGAENPQVRLGAANAILDRAYGKPLQEQKHTGDEDNPIRHIIERRIIDG